MRAPVRMVGAGRGARHAAVELNGGTPALRGFDDATLLDMYENAREHRDELCDKLSAELRWRGIAVKPCSHAHAD